jgi:mono/diheme cytochrome c family protein
LATTDLIREVAMLPSFAIHPTRVLTRRTIMIAGARACCGRWFGVLGILLGILFLISSARPQAKSDARADAKSPAAVDFNRQILPLLSENCFACHGPDEKQRKAKLRLDTKEGAFAELKSGGHAIVPGKAAESKMIEKITAADPKDRMPPAKTGKQLKPEQIVLLKQWIDQGARWTKHWAWTAPQRPAVPKVVDVGWPVNPIDDFILARLEAEGLHPSPPEVSAKLLRRVTLDLTGLPPTPAEIDAFLADHSARAYEKVIDRLLESPRFGDHMARYWLDEARYGDTHGLHLDNFREMWPYRDWVIKAFNANLPYDQFVIEQLAGDMLPNATLDQIVASGFNRCHVTTNEGGSIDEEVYVRNVDDRVDTTSEVFLGLTMGCSRCHDHKYDPIKQKDYYQLFAIFNSLDEKAMDDNASLPPPIARIPTPDEKAALTKLDQKVEMLKQRITTELAQAKYDNALDGKSSPQQARAEYVWVDDDIPPGAKSSSDGNPNGQWNFVTKPQHPVYSGNKSVMRLSEGLSQQFFESAQPGLRVGEDDVLFCYVYLDPTKLPKEIMLQWNTGGWNHRAFWGANVIPWGTDGTPQRRSMGALPETGKWVRLEVECAKVGLTPGMVINGWAFTQHGGTVYWDKAGIVTRVPQGTGPFDSMSGWLQVQRAIKGAGLPKPIADLILLETAKMNETQKKQLRDYFIEYAYAKMRPIFDPLHKEIVDVQKEREGMTAKMTATLVSKELSQPRPAFILKRGEYDQKGQPVQRDTPAFLPPLPKDAPKNRLSFARWLLGRENPLTARVAVNRLWQQVFGAGLVKTAEDFGSQGERPSHPELLDWLAMQFIDDGWDVKKMMKRLVMSATYRQTSRETADRLAKDPDNRLLSRGPRYRLDAEMIRDQALFVSGLLVERSGGPSVKPPQPGGLWEAVGYTASNTAKFVADKGCEKVHRRSLYTFWKRTSPPPQMTTLDAPSRESCTVRRERTDTPLQALLLMNERQFVECARALAERVLHEAGAQPEARLALMFKLATSRSPDARESAELLAAYQDHLANYSKNVEAAKKLIAVGESKPDPRLNPSELAAWTMIGNLILNLDEVMNKG